MSTVKDWLSTKESELTALCRRWLVVLTDERIIAARGWNPEECAALAVLIEAYLAALAAYDRVNSSDNRITKDATKKEAVAWIRRFANASVRYNSKMSDVDRATMGIRQKDTTPTVHPRPTVRPETVVENTKNRLEHLVKAINNENGKTSKPAGVHGVRFGWQVGGEKPTGGEDLPKTRFSQKPTFVITYVEADKGKAVWYATCYENSRGETGPWSLLADAYIG